MVNNNKNLKKEKVVPKKIEEKEIVKDEEEKSNKKKLLLLLLLLLFILTFGASVTFGKDFFDSVSENIIQVLNKPTAPTINITDKGWTAEGLVQIEIDSNTKSGLSHYEYCISDKKDTKDCEWKKTDTKNIQVTETGNHYVTFRGVDEKGNVGYESNTIEVKVDNSNPTINKLKLKEVTKNSIKIEVEAKDTESGIEGYYYSLDGKTYEKGTKEHTYSNLKPSTEYMVYVKVIDKVGNETVLSMPVKTLGEETKEEIETPEENDTTDNETDKENNDKEDNDESNKEENDENDNENDNNTDDNNNEDDKDNTDNEDNKDEEEIIVPEINLDKVPSSFIYGESYELPSFVDFKTDTGTVECIVEGKEYKDTKTLSIGKHLIVCTATSSKNIKVMVDKEVEVKVEEGEEEVWDGWIRLNLYYPENSTNWEWRLGTEEEIRTGYENSGWQAYTGPILVKLEDVDDVYIRYDIAGKTYIVAPNGKVAVDIEPNRYTLNKGETTKVKIYYEEGSSIKEYRIDGGEWQEYKEEFEVGVNQVIEAKATKEERVYDNEGNYVYTSKRIGTDSVFISEYVESEATGGGTTSGGISYGSYYTSGGYYVTSPSRGSRPTTYLAGPVISSNPSTGTVESTKVKVTPQEVAEKVYISIGNGKYEEYTGEVEVNQNTLIKAYYVRYSDGKVSNTSYYYVQNIKVENKPYVRIDANPSNYLTEEVESVEVSISGSDYDRLEYSLDGVIYQEYTNPITITESTTVYAKGTNANGETIETRTITTKTSPTPKEQLDVSIHLNPEANEVEGLTNKTIVSINYDSKATKKYYKIGYFSSWQEYTGEFELTSNGTIYAYCTSENGQGETKKKVSYLTIGIIDPEIKTTPKSAAQQVKIEIEYDKNAEIMRYQVGNGPMLDYNGAFYVYENTEITAYNKNSLGYEATSKYTVDNIVEAPKYTVIEKGKYFIIKLNYPAEAPKESREYKWKPTGDWKVYDNKGILLIKPEYKDEFNIESVDGIKVEDENGNEVIFKDHYYLVDVPLSELMENLFMRWDNAKVEAPQIVINPNKEPTKEVEVGILYSSSLVKKYYRVVKEDGTNTGWQEYTGSFKVDKNNTVIYAKGTSINGNNSEVVSVKVTNIDEISPGLEVLGDLTSPKQRVTLTVKALDNMGIDKVKWASGDKEAEYFKKNGTLMSNNGTFTVEENGTYTVYAEDYLGQAVTMKVEVTNIDKNAPDIVIDVLTEKYGTEAEVSIDYGNSKTKEYSIGNNTSYKTYTENITISSNDVLNLANEDGSLTIYARGTDEAGNIQEVSEKIYVLDLDAPVEPIIHATAGYPILTEYGVTLGSDSYIVFDQTRDDVDNYYSIDNGETWKRYTGPFEIESGTIIAKSVKKESGLTVTTTKKIDQPSDALGADAYDPKLESAAIFTGSVKIYVSEEVYGKNISVISNSGTVDGAYSRGTYITAIGPNEETLGEVLTYSTDQTFTIPENTKYIRLTSRHGYHAISIYDLSIDIYPGINQVQYYPKITEYGIEAGYNEVKINYFQTSVQRLYRINEGEWQEYKNKYIRLELDDVIEAKGIDKYGKETDIITYESKLVSDALGPNAYDEIDTSTTVFTPTARVDVSEEMWGNDIIYISNSGTVGGTYSRGTYITAIGQNGETLNEILTYSSNQPYTIPQNTKYIKLTSIYNYGITVYELKIDNYPDINEVKYYPTITENGIEPGYNEVTINYFQTSVQKLYRINDGEWKKYQNKSIRLEIDDVIEAKGIDRNGKETIITSLESKLVSDAVGANAYDRIDTSAVTFKGSVKINVSQDMYDKKFNFLSNSGTVSGAYSRGTYITAIGPNEETLNEVLTYSSNQPYTIPDNTKYIKFTSRRSNHVISVYELKINSAPTISQTNTYPTLTANGLSDLSIEAKISYLSYLPQKLYSLDNGTTWQTYTEPFKVKVGDIIKAKGILEDGTETTVTSYTVANVTDYLVLNTNISKKTTKTFTITDLDNQTLRIYTTAQPATDSYIKLYKSDNTEEIVYLTSTITTLKVPAGTIKADIYTGSSALNISDINIRTNIVDKTLSVPKIKISTPEWTVNKVVEITYPEGYRNEYSLDLGATWQEYTTEIIVNEQTTVLARTIDEAGKVISSSSFTITKVDSTKPTIEITETDILIGTDYNLPSTYTVDETKSGGSAICKIGEEEITNTKDLAIGSYEITCTVTTGAGNETTIIKTINIIDETIGITLELPEKILVGESNPLPTSVTGSNYVCKVGETKITDTKELEVGTHEITCTITSIGGNTETKTDIVEIYEEKVEEETTEEETTEESEVVEDETITE